MFSMFFGAGNVVFPLLVGKMVGDQAMYAIIGLFLTAVGVPFIGLLAMVLYNGDYEEFFGRIGRVPGFLLTAFIMVLIGPFGATPRCIALSYSTLKMYAPALSAVVFSFIACLVIYFAARRRTRLVDLLGAVLSPLLVVSLSIIIIKGILVHPVAPASALSAVEALKLGLSEGYNTMDLLGTFFFSGVVIAGLKQALPATERSQSEIARYALWASVLGALLLGLVYAGFVLVASYYAGPLSVITSEAVLLSVIARLVLGTAGGFIVSMAVVLACLTTAITLVAVFAEFLHEKIFAKHVCYHSSLVLTLLVTFVFANLKFSEIVAMLVPVLVIVYPALLALAVVNILHRVYGFSMVKTPVVGAIAAALISYHAPHLLGQLMSAF